MQEQIQENTIPCYNPATGELLGHSPLTSSGELSELFHQARYAQQEWAAVPVKKRAEYVLKIRDYIVKHADRIARVIHEDNGKTLVDAMATEVLSSAIAANYYARNASKFLRPKRLRAGNIILSYKKSTIYREPFGIIGIISPWNYPFTIPFHEVIIALLCGNAVILKVARETQMVGKILKECIDAGGLPEGVFHYVNMSGRVFSGQILDLGVDKIFFTGGQIAGEQILAKASETLTPVSLELGSNDAMIICKDADLERAASGAVWAGLQNAGQSCGGVERIYVHEAVYEQFLKQLKIYTQHLSGGRQQGKNSDYGVMTTEEQIQTVEAHLKDALEKGATIYAESEPPDEHGLRNFIPARILTNVTHDMLVMRRETFGPILAVMPFQAEQEAIELANDSDLGLTSSVWSRNTSHAVSVARRIESGAVTINDHLISHGMAETPWGGFKKSGIGRTHGQFGFEEMTQPQVIVEDRLSFTKRALWWHPYSTKLYDGLLAILHFLYAQSLRVKISGLWGTLKIVPRIFKTWRPD